MNDWGRRLVRRIRRAISGQRSVWNGVYARYADVPTHRADYADELTDEMAGQAGDTLAQWRAGRKPYLWHQALAVVAGAVAVRGTIRVVDFGGGVGTGFSQLVTSLPPETVIDYWVIDSPEMCAAGRRVFAEDTRVHFVTALAEVPPAVDIVYANGVFCYIDDYAAALRMLTELRAPYLLFDRLAAGSGPTFASQQLNLPGRVFAYWFINVDELIAILESSGYAVVSDTLKSHFYDQSNLPETHRVQRFRTMLFRRRD